MSPMAAAPDSRPTLARALRDASARLAEASDSPGLDAELLLACALGRTRSHLHAWPERQLDAASAGRFADLVRRRARGWPVAYLTGRREFWSLSLEVTPDVLIPRPETETLVEAALACLPPDAPLRLLDAGTGSGAIALALASERPAWRLLACDRSAPALAVARRNRDRLGLARRVGLVRSDWCAAFAPGSLDAIVANPPYVADADPHLERGDVRFEPVGALRAGPDGLAAIQRLVQQAPRCLRPGGWLLLEHGWDQGAAVRRLLRRAGFRAVATRRDPAGRERVGLGRWIRS